MGLGVSALLASAILGVLATIVAAVTSPLGLAIAAIAGATVAFFRWTAAGQAAYRSLSATLGKLLSRVREVFGGIVAAIKSGKFELAFDIMKTAAKLAFAVIAARAKYVFKTFIPGLLSAVFQGMLGGFSAVIEGWREPLRAYFELLKTRIVVAFDFWKAAMRAQFQLAGDLARILWDNFPALAEVAIQDSLAFLINGMITVGQFIRDTLSNAFTFAVRFFVETGTWAAKKVAGMAKNAVLGIFRGGAQSDMAKAFEGARKRHDEQAQRKQAGLRDAAIAGIAGQYADADAVIAAMTEQTTKALADYAQRVAEAGTQAAATLLPAEREFAAAIAGLGVDVRDRFMERFRTAFAEVEDYKDPKAVSALREKLNALIAEASAAKRPAVGGPPAATAGGGPVAGGGPGVGGGGLAVAAAPRGVALTATYSAAAARIAGYQPGGGGPEKKMADGISAIEKNTKEMEKNTKDMAMQQQQFLAGWKVA
jgi:hypothetical protein